MKNSIQQVLRKFGYEITKLDLKKSKSYRTNQVSFYKAKTGNYYLPTDILVDEIAFAFKNDLVFDLNVYETSKKFIKQGTTVLDVGSNFDRWQLRCQD